MKPTLYSYLACLLLVGCGYNHFEDLPPRVALAPTPTISLEQLHALYPGHTVEVAGSGVVFQGRVTTSDRAGNFYRSLMVQQGEWAVEIRAGLYDLFTRYPLGQLLTVRADGLALSESQGVLQLGLMPSDPTDVAAYLGHAYVVDQYLYASDSIEPIAPELIDLRAIDPDWVGRLVRVEGVRLDPAQDTTWAVAAERSYNGFAQRGRLKFRQTPFDSIYVETSGYARFADSRVPLGELDIVGILLRDRVGSEEVYLIKMRDETDVTEHK